MMVIPERFRWLKGKLLIGLCFAVVGFTLCDILYHHDPSVTHFYPRCFFHQVTGLYCPGCGATRALYQLLHGHVLIALHDNLFFVFALPGLFIAAVVNAFSRDCFRRIISEKTIVILHTIMLYAILAFWVLRNIPIFPFTLLAPYR